MKPFEYVAPETAEKAVAILAEFSPNAKALAGGTDLLVDIKHLPHVPHLPSAPKVLVDVGRIPDFKGIAMTDAGLRIGSTVTHSQIMKDPLIAEHAPRMIDAARTIGAVQTRNLGTLGGNLVTAVPSADSPPVLIALGALVSIVGPEGTREVTLEEFFTGPRRTVLKPEELIAAIIIPTNMLGRGCGFRKFGLRKGQALALVNVAASFDIDAKGNIADPRICLGAVAPVPMRAPKAEESLVGKKPDDSAFTEAAEIAMTEAKPINDFRASADYRRQLVKALTKRVLEEARDQKTVS